MRRSIRTYHDMELWLRNNLSRAGRVSISWMLSIRFLLMFSSVNDLKQDRFAMRLMRLPGCSSSIFREVKENEIKSIV